MTLYLVHGNTYYESYGYSESVFGVFTEKDAAESARDLVIKELYEKEMKNAYTKVEDISDIGIEVLEIEADKITERCLGGYVE
jgi:hypothetical protein